MCAALLSKRGILSVISWAFLLAIVFFIYQMDEHLTEVYQVPEKEDGHLLNDALASSALSRMRTNECKLMMNQWLGLVDGPNWPVPETNNTCQQHYDPSERYAHIGCFRDSVQDRMLKEYRFNLSTLNTPELCVQNCLRAGFTYAGVEFAVECFCGGPLAEQHFAYRRIDDIHCQQYPCPGNNTAFCGGFEAIKVFRTGVKGNSTQQMPQYRPFEFARLSSYPTVKILFLFQLNGRDSRQIRRLLRMIYSPNHLYLVHVDRRLHFMNSEVLKIQHSLVSKNLHNFKVINRRMATIWGGTSLLELFLHAIAMTLNSGESAWQQWDFVLNLSEVDMPVLSLQELELNLASVKGKSFLSSHGYNTAKFLHKQGFNFYFMECEQRMWRVATRKEFPRDLRLDGGSDWVIVHRRLAEFAISSSELPSQLRLLFSTILLPLESFFHTLALNSGAFCQSIIHRNLRFTNWRRKQGCRCAVLKPIVDWCGCSPLALRSNDPSAIAKIQQPEKCQAKSLYFGRKFDSFVDPDPISYIEQRVLRFRPELIPSHIAASFNSTWINLYYDQHTLTDTDSPFDSKLNLLNALLRLLIHRHFQQCNLRRLLAIYVYKHNNSAPPQSVLTLELECQQMPFIRTYEILLGQLNKQTIDSTHPIIISNGMDDAFLFKPSIGITYGIGFDVKEEIFRTYPPLIDLNNKFTLLWNWEFSGVMRTNWTSPGVDVELHGPDGELKLLVNVEPYDSINGNQFVQIQMSNEIQNAKPGIWKAVLFAQVLKRRVKLTEASIPIFPIIGTEPVEKNGVIEEDLSRLLASHHFFTLLSFCLVNDPSTLEHSQIIDSSQDCIEQSWSSFYPDEKSTFP